MWACTGERFQSLRDRREGEEAKGNPPEEQHIAARDPRGRPLLIQAEAMARSEGEVELLLFSLAMLLLSPPSRDAA